jgi:hypothetical protein
MYSSPGRAASLDQADSVASILTRTVEGSFGLPDLNGMVRRLIFQERREIVK